jgi:hypothetical protein
MTATRIAQLVQQLATDWAVRGSTHCGRESSVTVQIVPEAHSASCTMAKNSSLRLSRPGHGVDYLFLLALGYE